jgi:hypothetical protein
LVFAPPRALALAASAASPPSSRPRCPIIIVSADNNKIGGEENESDQRTGASPKKNRAKN